MISLEERLGCWMETKVGLLWVMLASAAMMAAGCGTAPHPVEPSDKGVTTVGGVDIQDWDRAAGDLANQMLKKLPPPPAGSCWLIGVSAIKNDTRDPELPIHVLTDKITNVLSSSGVAKTLSFEQADYEQAVLNHRLHPDLYPMPLEPNYTLGGSITELHVREGRDRQSTFIFQLQCKDMKTSVLEWQGNCQLTKRATKPGIGL